MAIGKTRRLPLRDVWPKEDADFTPWLADNLDELTEKLGFEMSDPETEQAAGSFSVDIKARDGDGGVVIIENQYGKSDHDHFGKLFTYSSILDARKAIWIVEDDRPEHVTALTKLDRDTPDCDFYMLRAAGIKIGDSPAALITEKIVGRNIEKKQIRRAKSESESLRFKFWEQFIEALPNRSDLFGGASPTRDSWISKGAGKTGVAYQCWCNASNVRIELRIQPPTGGESQRKEESQRIFEHLKRHREAIDHSLGEGFEWFEPEDKIVRAIRKTLDRGGYKSDESEWPAIINEMIDEMRKLEESTREIIRNL